MGRGFSGSWEAGSKGREQDTKCIFVPRGEFPRICTKIRRMITEEKSVQTIYRFQCREEK